MLQLWRRPYLHDRSGETQGGCWYLFHKRQTSLFLWGFIELWFFCLLWGAVAFDMAIGIAVLTVWSLVATTRKTRSQISGLTVWRPEWTLNTFCSFDELRKICVSFCFKCQMVFWMSGFVLEINCNMMNWDEFGSTGWPNLARRWRLFWSEMWSNQFCNSLFHHRNFRSRTTTLYFWWFVNADLKLV